MPKSITQVEKAGRRRQILADLLTRANTHFYFFKELFAAYNGEYHDEMYKSLEFWTYTLRAHMEAAVLNLCKVLDKSPGTVRLHDLVSDAKKNGLRPDSWQSFAGDLAFCNANGHKNPTLKNLRGWRHELIAHVDLDQALSRPGSVEKLVFDQEAIQKLIDECFAILERWTPPDEPNCSDGTKMVWPKTFRRHIPAKETYRVVLDSLRAGMRQ
jgi:hypothetical protein